MSKQNITVGIRIRPLLKQLHEHLQEQCISIDGNTLTINNKHKSKQFSFPIIYDKTATQQQVYERFGFPLVEDFLNGYSCCLIAYGQDKSGKSYSLNGKQSEESKGLIYRIIDHISERLTLPSKSKITFMMRVSYLEINQETVTDLLSIRRNVNIEIIQDKFKEIVLKNIQSKPINKIDEIESYLEIGNRKRNTAYSKKTRLPEKSSTIFTIQIESREQTETNSFNYKKSRLSIVDLCASEILSRFDSVYALGDGRAKYNLSRESFKNVITSLVYGNQKSIVPFNDSKTTKILRNCFGGSIKTKILFHINPMVELYQASLNVLRIAAAAAQIQNIPTCYVDLNQIKIEQKINALADLKLSLKSINEEIQKQQQRMSNESQMNLEDKQQIPEQVMDNQFVSKQQLKNNLKSAHIKKMNLLHQHRLKIRKQIQQTQSLFLWVTPVTDIDKINLMLKNHQKAIQKMNNLSSLKPNKNMNDSQYIVYHDLEEANAQIKKLRDRQRIWKKQIFDLNQQFEKERQMMTKSIRDLEQKFKFYSTISNTIMKKQQIEIIKMSSKYDETKRSYDVPNFSIKQKKVSYGSRFYSPNSINRSLSAKSIAQRRFFVNQITQKNFQKPLLANKSPQSHTHSHKKIIQINRDVGTNIYKSNADSYFHKHFIKQKPKQKKYTTYLPQNEYELKKIISPSKIEKKKQPILKKSNQINKKIGNIKNIEDNQSQT